MHLTQEQIDAVRGGTPLHLHQQGTDVVVLRADVFERLHGLLLQVAPTTPAWNRWFEKIESCRALQDGWNGYTAPAPNDKSLDHARLFLQEMQLAGIEPTRVAPSAMGGMAITRRVNGRKVFVECYNDGRIYSLFSEKSVEMKVTPVEANPLAIRAVIANMRDYVDVEYAA